MLSLNYKDVGAIASSRFWRTRNRSNIMWFSFIGCVMATLFLFVSVYGADFYGDSEVYVSESGQEVVITGDNVRLDGELLEKDAMEGASTGFENMVVSFIPLLAWAGIICYFNYRANNLKTMYRKEWENDNTIPAPSD